MTSWLLSDWPRMCSPESKGVSMRYPTEEPRHYGAGFYVCPVTKSSLLLESDVPRPWVEWPVRVQCKACGSEHLIDYDDVRQQEPVFGHE